MRHRRLSTIHFPASVAAEPPMMRRVNRQPLVRALPAVATVALAALAGMMVSTPGHVRWAIGSSSHAQPQLPAAASLAISRSLGVDLAEYRLARSPGGFLAHNARQGLTANFGTSGATVSTSGGAHASIALRAIGSGAALHPVGLARPLARGGNRVEYRRDGATEWFANGPAGVEQGFTIPTKPAGASHGTLTLALGLSGTFTARPGMGGGLLLIGAGDKALLRYGDLSVADAHGRSLPARLAVEHGRVLISVDTRGARYPLTVDPLVQDAELTAADGAPEDDLGNSVAVSGSTIAVGAPQHSVNGHSEAGAVYVFSKPASGEWANATQTAELTASDGVESDALGVSVAVSASGSTIVAGASRHGGEAGAVYVFSKPASGGWKNATQTAELTATGGAAPDALGHSVAASGSTIVAGAPGASSYQGAVYVFSEPLSGGWKNATQTAELTASDPGAAYDVLGGSVAVSGPTIVAGAAGHTVNGHLRQGAVYVFSEPASGGWKNATQTAELTAADGVANDTMGAVAISEPGSTIVAGAAGHKVNGVSEAGAAYVFTEPLSDNWETTTQTAELTAASPGAADFLGGSVAVSGSTIVAGAAFHAANGHHWQGAAYAFSKPVSDSWENATQTAELTAADGAAGDELGWSVAASGTTIVAGAPGRMINGNNDQGAAYVLPFALPTASIVTPAEGGSYTQGQSLTAEFTCTAATGATLKPGTAGCSGSVANGAAIDTSVPGHYIFTVTATDTDGHNSTTTSSYTVTPKTTGAESAPETPLSSTTPATSTTATSTPSSGNPISVATSPKAVEELLNGCSGSPLVLNDVYIQGAHVEIRGSAAKSYVGKKVKILFNEGKQVATATVEANGQYTTTAPLPPAKVRDNLDTRYTAEIGKLRSVHLKLVRRLLLEPPKASGTTVTITGQLTPPLAKPIAPVTVEQQLECGKTTVAKTFTPSANGRFDITLAVPANAKAAIFRLTSKVAANKHSVTHGFTTFSLPLPVAIG